MLDSCPSGAVPGRRYVNINHAVLLVSILAQQAAAFRQQQAAGPVLPLPACCSELLSVRHGACSSRRGKAWQGLETFVHSVLTRALAHDCLPTWRNRCRLATTALLEV